jgi:hypothetical protein
LDSPANNGRSHEEVEVHGIEIVAVLKEGEAGVPVADLTRTYGISRATYFKWRSKYAGVSVNELKRMKELEAENAKLKPRWTLIQAVKPGLTPPDIVPLTGQIAAIGLPAVHASSDAVVEVGAIVIRGTLLSIVQGSEVERVTIGLGKGVAGLATFAATKNPLGLIVSTGVKLHDEKTGSATIQGKVQQVAAQFAQELRPRFEQQGWIAPQAN